jgi:uracil-DNA glycosylase
MNQIALLRESISFLERENRFGGAPYPPSLSPFPGVLTGQGFFPGGDGLWHPDITKPTDKPFPEHGIMVLGNDFGVLSDFEGCLERGFEDPKTWNIKATLHRAGVPLSECFFTNAYLGLRRLKPSTGCSPGLLTDGFAKMCADFFDLQVSIQQPRGIICLGKEPRQFLAHKVFGPRHRWCSGDSFSVLDQIYHPIQEANISTGKITKKVQITTIYHPSYGELNNRQYPRSFGAAVGAEAETKVLIEFWEKTNNKLKGR